MRLLTSNEMKLVEQYTAKFGLSYQRMMEKCRCRLCKKH